MNHQAPRFLIADDDPVSRRRVEAVLNGLGDVTVVDNGEAALAAVLAAAAKGLHFDTLLVDLYMPGRDGIATVQAIRAAEHRGHWPRMRIAVHSVMRAPRLIHSQLQELVDGVLGKPLDRRQLVNYLRQWGLLVHAPDRNEAAQATTTLLRRKGAGAGEQQSSG